VTETRWARSPSQLSMFERCPKSFEFARIKKYPLATSWQIRGRAMHAAVEAHYRQKLDTGEGIPATECIEHYQEAVRLAFSPLAHEEVVLFHGESEERIRRDGSAALQVYLTDIAPTITPVMIEESLDMTLPSGLRLRGRVDLIDDAFRIRDLKTLTDPMDPATLPYAWQSAVYPALVESQSGRLPEMIFDTVVLGRAKEPKPKAISVPWRATPAFVESRLRDLEAIDAQINLGLFPRRPSLFNCSKCPFRPACWSGLMPPADEAPERDLAPLLQASVDAVIVKKSGLVTAMGPLPE
jgi:hypothetical protein